MFTLLPNKCIYVEALQCAMSCDFETAIHVAEVGKWLLRWTFELLYLDISEVENCFVEDLYSINPQNEELIAYADYLVDSYISIKENFRSI